MTHRPVEDLIREADRDLTSSTSKEGRLWDRIESGLDADDVVALPTTHTATAGAIRSSSSMHVVHRAGRQRLNRLLSIAATLLLLLVAAWWLADGGVSDSGTLTAGGGGSQHFDRLSLEGELELEGLPSPVLRREVYEGVVVKNGDQSITALRVCSPC